MIKKALVHLKWMSFDEKRRMIEDSGIADQILRIAYNYNRELNDLLHELKDKLSEEDQKKLRRAIGHLISENFARLIEPIFRKHPDKVPEEMKDMPL
jgi:predicted transcriptional regulator